MKRILIALLLMVLACACAPQTQIVYVEVTPEPELTEMEKHAYVALEVLKGQVYSPQNLQINTMRGYYCGEEYEDYPYTFRIDASIQNEFGGYGREQFYIGINFEVFQFAFIKKDRILNRYNEDLSINIDVDRVLRLWLRDYHSLLEDTPEPS